MNSFDQENQSRRNSHKKPLKNHQMSPKLAGNPKQDFKEVYMCECGKQYQSFPATYLHFRSKHDIKLSTKASERRKVVEIEGDTKKITYVLEIKNQQKLSSPQNSQNFDQPVPIDKDHDLCPEIKLAHSCIRRYLNAHKFQNQGLYLRLIKFISMRYKQKMGKQNPAIVDQIPYFLNDFALDYLPKYFECIKVGSQQWKQCCSQLKSFCDWLRVEKYTDLLVIYDKV